MKAAHLEAQDHLLLWCMLRIPAQCGWLLSSVSYFFPHTHINFNNGGHSICAGYTKYSQTRYNIMKGKLHLKCDGTCSETTFCLSAKRTSPFKLAGASVLSTTGSRGVRISGSNAGYTMFQGSVKSTGYTLHLPVSPSLPLHCVTVCHHISTGLYRLICLVTKQCCSNEGV